MLSEQEIRSIFTTMSDEDVRLLAARLRPHVYDTSRVYNDVRDDRKIRVTANQADVTDTSGGTEIKYPGESYADHLNFMPPLTVDVQSRERGRQYNIRGGGGGADCMFDYLVSTCWATEVAAGRGTEGQVMTSLTGCTFRVYSTVQAAVTHADSVDAQRTIFVCGGTYAETVTTVMNHGLRIIGAGRERTLITSPGGSTPAYIPQHNISTANHQMIWEDLTLNGSSYGMDWLTSGSEGDNCTFIRCNIRGTSGGIRVAGGSNGPSKYRFYDCSISSILIAGTPSGSTNANMQEFRMYGGTLGGLDYEAQSNAANSNLVHFYDVDYTGTLRFPPTNDLYLSGKFTITSPTKQLVFGKATNSIETFTRVRLDLQFDAMNATSAARYYIEVEADTHINGLIDTSQYEYPSNVTNTVNYIKVQGSGANISDALFAGAFGTSSGNSLEDNTTYKSIDASSGFISNSVFNCTPTDFEFAVGSGTGNALGAAQQFGAGTPTHTANGGQLYYDLTNDIQYVNTSAADTPGTGWAIVGVSGGGAAAPSPHNLVSTHHDGEQDFTNTLGLAALQIDDANFNLDISSSNPRITFASGDYIEYDRSFNFWDFVVGSSSEMIVSGAGVDVTNDLQIGGLARLPVTAKTIASDQIAVAAGATGGSHITLAGESGAADDLDGITGGTQGDIIILSAVSDSVTITVKHNNAGGSSGAKIFLAQDADVVLDDFDKTLTLIYKTALDSGNGGWMEVTSTADKYVEHQFVFQPETSELEAATLMPPRLCVGESGEHGTFAAIRAKATAGTAGSGTNTILIEADDNPAFSSATTLFTLALNTSTEVDDTTLDNTWDANDIFIRARCTAVDADFPEEVVVEFFFKQRVTRF